ncbi:hypothetical protein IM687_13735 [Stutzerimonas stutzeri]|uniref:DUF7483 domain-containing protein n=1 Tax=Stutzerimonas stutzeri TaxID=316 RepID=UPI0018AB509B|nr:hypothetical protein [Stutzerimonas stutzeri]QPI08259.1 hypothetical protein IM687_13735 [Stutzerimonas stutzeri]
MSVAKKLMISGGNWADIRTLFATSLYTGNGATQTLDNGINLSGEGGLVWIKRRNSSADHHLFDTDRGATKYLSTNSTANETVGSTTLTSFLDNGYSIGSASSINGSGSPHVSWSFRKSPRFFDIVTYTGNGVAGRQIPHRLGVPPGLLVVKMLSIDPWRLQHRSVAATHNLSINTTAAATASETIWNNTAADELSFTLGSSGSVNASGLSYVAYLFAHDPSSDGVIQCGSYTGNGLSLGPTINLGWKPQYLLIKNASSTGDWFVFDAVRGINSGNEPFLRANLADAESSNQYVNIFDTGFQVATTASGVNASSNSYIYMAIRAPE